MLRDASVDVLHASTRRFRQAEFACSNLNLAGWTKKTTNKPVITVGSFGLDDDFIGDGKSELSGSSNPSDIEHLLKRLNDDEFDLVAIG